SLVAAPGSAGDPLGLVGDAYGYRTKASFVLEAGTSMAGVTEIDVLERHYFDGPGGTSVIAAPPGSPYSYLLRNMNDGIFHDVTLGVVVSPTFTIDRATTTLTVRDAGGTYSGSPFAATVALNNVNGASLEGVTPSLTYYIG